MPEHCRQRTLPVLVVMVIASVALLAQEPDQARLEGRVLEAGTDRPVAGVPVGALRASRLKNLPDGAAVRPEATLQTDREGRFELEVPGNMSGIDRVILFTASPSHVNQITGGVEYKGDRPRKADLLAEGVKVVDLRAGETIEFHLRPRGNVLTVMVPMRDGTRLATDVYLPEGDGPWPVVLVRTPYGKKGAAAPAINRLGYALVVQDARGRFESEGDNLPFLADGWGEQQDGYDVAAWIAEQTWCNGKIATQGGSALGITQILSAGANPPQVVCQSIGVACGSLYHHAAYVGGAFRKALVENWLTGNKFDPRALELMRDHERYDDFWRQLDASTRSDRIGLPGQFSGGWYDVFSQGTIDAFRWRQEHGAPGARGKQKLLMGPWGHGRSQTIGELTYPDNSLNPTGSTSFEEWLAFWLKGADNGVDKAPAVTYYVMGDVDDPNAPGNEWRTSDRWPVEYTPVPAYFQADGDLSLEPPAADAQPLRYVYDPDDPVPTRGGNNLTIPKGPFDQRPVENRDDVLLFTSDPLDNPLEVTGPIKARLWVSSSAVDTDFTVKLCDVYPDGRSMLVIDGILRMRHRNTFERNELMTPGEVYPIEVDMWSTSLVFAPGHRVRVAVSSSNYPRFDVNKNTGKAWDDETKQKAENIVYVDADRPSHIVLPVVEE